MTKVSLRITTMVLEPQEVITRDNVTVRVDAVVYFMVIDPVKAVINVEEYKQAIIQLALTTLGASSASQKWMRTLLRVVNAS